VAYPIGWSVCLSVSVQWVNYGKMADWFWMPFAVVSGVGSGICVLDGVQIVQVKGEVLVFSGPLV